MRRFLNRSCAAGAAVCLWLAAGGCATPEPGAVRPVYVIVSSAATAADPDWARVIETLRVKHAARVITHTGAAFPEETRAAVAGAAPRYIGFVARPEEATDAYVRACHQFARRLDEDAYGDACWGIVTGFDASNALRIAACAGPLPVRTVLSKIEGPRWLESVTAGVSHSEFKTGEMYTRRAGEPPVFHTDGPEDDTFPMVDLLNSNAVDLVVSSGHATEFDWQLHFPAPRPEGFFLCEKGQLFGRNGRGERRDITTTNPKIYWAPGNCLIGRIPPRRREDCMALGWMKSGGAVQFCGYLVPTWYGYMGWGIGDYFLGGQGRWTFAESFFLNNQALLFEEHIHSPGTVPEGMAHDRDAVAFYGDPAFDARVVAAGKPDYDQQLDLRTAAGKVTGTLTVTVHRELKTLRPAVARFPVRLHNPRILDAAGLAADICDDFLIVRLWKKGDPDLQPGATWTLRFEADAAPAP